MTGVYRIKKNWSALSNQRPVTPQLITRHFPVQIHQLTGPQRPALLTHPSPGAFTLAADTSTKATRPINIMSAASDQNRRQYGWRWIQILENLYYIFRIQPYGVKGLRTAKKERKLYFWDWSLCESTGGRFENLKSITFLLSLNFRAHLPGQ